MGRRGKYHRASVSSPTAGCACVHTRPLPPNSGCAPTVGTSTTTRFSGGCSLRNRCGLSCVHVHGQSRCYVPSTRLVGVVRLFDLPAFGLWCCLSGDLEGFTHAHARAHRLCTRPRTHTHTLARAGIHARARMHARTHIQTHNPRRQRGSSALNAQDRAAATPKRWRTQMFSPPS